MLNLNEGILQMNLVEAKLTRDTEVMGSMSPYVTMVFKGKKYKSKTLDYAGKTPKWNQKFTFEVTSADEDLMLRVWDQDMTTSDAVGFVKLKMSSLIINKGVDAWFDIMYENKGAGQVHLSTVFEPAGGDAFEQMQEQLNEQNAQLQAEAQEAQQKAAEMEQKSQQLEAALQSQQMAQQQQNAKLQEMMQNEGAQNAQVMQMQQEQAAAQAKLAQQAQEIEALKRNAQSLTNVNGAAHVGAYQGGMYGQAPMGQAPMGGAPMGAPPMMGGMQQPYGAPPMGQMPGQMPGYGQPQMGMQQPYGAPPMGQMPGQMPGYGAPQMGMQPMGMQQPQYGQMPGQMPGYGAPQMGMQPQMYQQPGMQPGMQPMPMGGMPQQQPMYQYQQQPMMGQPMQTGPKVCYCPQNHPMQWLNTNPYPGSVAVTCDICNKDIAIAYWYHHCYTCESDFCQTCGGPRMR